MAKKDKDKISVSVDFLDSCIWMSARYCIGRHTIASSWHAGAMVPYIIQLRNSKQTEMVEDFRREISSAISGYGSHISVTGDMEAGDAVSILLNYMIENNIKIPDLSEASYQIDINTDTGEVTKLLRVGEEPNKSHMNWLFMSIHDVLPWIKLSNLLDKKCHRTITYEGKDMEVMPYPDISEKDGTPSIKWITCEDYIKEPQRNIYIAPEHLKFK